VDLKLKHLELKMLVANSKDEVEARINAYGLKIEHGLNQAKKDLKSLSKNELINVIVAITGFGVVYDFDNVSKVVVKQSEVDAFNTLRILETDKINAIIETLALEAMVQQQKSGEENGVQQQEQSTEQE